MQIYWEDEDMDLIEDVQGLTSLNDAVQNNDDIEPDMYDKLLLTELNLNRDGKQTRAKIVGGSMMQAVSW